MINLSFQSESQKTTKTPVIGVFYFDFINPSVKIVAIFFILGMPSHGLHSNDTYNWGAISPKHRASYSCFRNSQLFQFLVNPSGCLPINKFLVLKGIHLNHCSFQCLILHSNDFGIKDCYIRPTANLDDFNVNWK